MNLLAQSLASPPALTAANDNYRLRLVVNKVLLEERTGGAATDYIYLNGRPLAMLTGTTFTYLHDDMIGTPRVATNASQGVVWKTSYLPFNTVIATSGTATVNLRMPGQYYDAESGLAHNGARDYTNVLGRYVESDPIGLAGGINTYAYVMNRPMDQSDPSGEASWSNTCRATATGFCLLLGTCTIDYPVDQPTIPDTQSESGLPSDTQGNLPPLDSPYVNPNDGSDPSGAGLPTQPDQAPQNLNSPADTLPPENPVPVAPSIPWSFPIPPSFFPPMIFPGGVNDPTNPSNQT